MKKFYIIILLALVMPFIAVAQDAKSVQSAISRTLNQRGIPNSPDSDGDLAISYQDLGVGTSNIFSNAYVSVTGEQPYFAKLFVSASYNNTVTREFIMSISNELNAYKCAKIIPFESVYQIQCEMYIKDATFFTAVFSRLCKQIGFVVSDLEEAISRRGGNSYSNNNNYGGGNSYGGSSYGNTRLVPTNLNELFPIDYTGIRLGDVIRNLENKGMKFEHDNDGTSNFAVNGNRYWDFNKDGRVNSVFIDEIPHLWESLYGFSREWSYDKWMQVMRDSGYKISIYSGDEPKTSTFQGRKVLKAEFKALAPDGSFEFYFWFNYGNKNGEGYSTSSPNTLDDFRVKINRY